MKVNITVNGKAYERDIEPRTLLVHFIRDVIGLTGTNIGCDTAQCGACTVHMNGLAIKSCAALAVQADGAEITTIEGLASNGHLHPMQQAFWDNHGLQCGYCTPGMIMTAWALLNQNPNPSDQQIIEGMEDNLCRCGAHKRIIEAIHVAAKEMGGF
jgi:aerobic carbon-monoxide dehydrogenase small subunit